jgi:hypothetical protein
MDRVFPLPIEPIANCRLPIADWSMLWLVGTVRRLGLEKPELSQRRTIGNRQSKIGNGSNRQLAMSLLPLRIL